jgi:methyltransferase (TIGR00027 family)
MTKGAAKTGVGPTVSVAIEQNFPVEQRIIADPVAYKILPRVMKTVVWMTRSSFFRDFIVAGLEKSAPGIWAGLMCRKRFIDEKLEESIDSYDAVLNLGAGFDTRPFRLQSLENKPIWEVDLTRNIKAKLNQLRKEFGEIPPNITLVPIDFDVEDLGVVLKRYEFTLMKRCFIIWEAVTQYLPEASVRKTLAYLANMQSGSRLVFTYVLKDFIEGKVTPDQEELYHKYVIKDKTWLYGLHPSDIEVFLLEYGWSLIEDLAYKELARRYVAPTGRNLASTPIERIVYAEKL